MPSYIDLLCNSENSVFSALTPDERKILGKQSEFREYKKASIVAVEGIPAWGILCVQLGVAKVFKVDKQGAEHIIRLVQPGDIIGVKAVISAAPYVNHAQALGELKAVFIPQETVWNLLRLNFAFCTEVMKLLAKELRLVESQLTQMASLPVRERIAETLMVLYEKFGLKPDKQTLNIALRRQDISYIVGADYTSTMRALSELKHESIIQTKGSGIKILNLSRLEQISRAR